MAGGVIAFYQFGYGIAAFGAAPLQHAGISLSAIFGFTAIIAGAMALLSFFVAPRHRPGPAERAAAGPGSSRPALASHRLASETGDSRSESSHTG